MSRYDDPPDEILDLGRPGWRVERDAPRELPPMHIDEQPPADDDEPTGRSPWWQWAVLGIAVVVGLILGVLSSNARRDATDLAAAESTVDLIAGEPRVANPPEADRETPFQVPIYNAGPLEVEVLWIRPQGWEIAQSTARRSTKLPPDQWVAVRVRAVPNCDELLSPDVLELRVRTQAREQTISLPLPRGGVMQEARTFSCQPFTPIGAYVDEVDVVQSTRPDTLTLRLRMLAFDPNLRFTLTDVSASAPGFRMIDASVPVQFERGARRIPLDIVWEIVGCEATQTLNEVNLGLEFHDEDGDRQTDGAELPGRGVAEMARFAIEQCGTGA
jgi:hypothetical protein